MSQPASFVQNTAALYAIQGLQYLVPLVVLPILTRELGSENFGKLAFWQALVGGLSLFIEYGFNYSAVRTISNLNRGSAELGKKFYTTLATRMLLFFPSALLLMFLPKYVAPELTDSVMQNLGLIALAANAMSPHWYLSGIKRNTFLAYASAIALGATVILTWLFVKGPEALHIAAAIQFTAPAITALAALWIVYRHEPPMFIATSIKDILQTLKEGMPAFLVASTSGMYSAINPFLLGLVASPSQVAFFSLGERLTRAARNLLSPMMAALFPYSSMQDKSVRASRVLRRIHVGILIVSAVITIAMAATAKWTVPLVSGEGFKPSIAITQVLSLTIFLIAASNLIGVQYLIAQGYDKPVSYITMILLPVHLLIFLAASKFYGAVGGAIAYTATETLIVAGFLFYILAKRQRA